MALIKKFSDFYRGLIFSNHYLDRTKYSNKDSRVTQKTPFNSDGWFCEYMIECDENGNQIGGRYKYNYFINKYQELYNLDYSSAYQECSSRITTVLKCMTTNPLIGTRINNCGFETYINLGKIMFEINTDEGIKYYCPLFTHNKIHHGSNVWLITNYNIAKTFKFMPDNFNVVSRSVFSSLVYNKNKIKQDFNLTPEDFMERHVLIDMDSINQTIIIRHTPDWMQYIYTQIEKS